MNIASIDIGSNTVLLLIAEVKNNYFNPLLNKYKMPRLGKSLSSNNAITKDRIDILFTVLDEYKKDIDEFGCDIVLVNATNAFRIATNSKSIIADIKKRYSFDVKIISGEEEALLSFWGAISSFQEKQDYMIVDIGGGSSEIIYGNANEIFFKHSFNIGVVNLTEKFIKGNLPLKSEILLMESDILKNLSEICRYIPNQPFAIAVAGTPTTLSCMIQNLKEYDENKVEGSIIRKSELIDYSKILSKLKPSEILEKFGSVVNGREDVLLAGVLELKCISELLNIDEFYVSGRGIRYGAILMWMKNHYNKL